MKPAAQRMEQFAPHFFAALSTRINTLQASGIDVIRLDEGSPDLPPAPQIIAALQRSASFPQKHCYQTHRGPLSLREAWAEMYHRVHGVNLNPENEIVPLVGSKEGIFHFPLAFVDPGDVVLIPDPGYITYTRGAAAAGGRPFYFRLPPETGYIPDLSSIPSEIARKTKILWLNYPNNPTGATASLDFFTQAVAFARQYDLILCHDAAYTQVTYDGYRAPSILEVPGAKEVAVEFNSLSKSHNMAGWRVGAVVGNAAILKTFYTLKTNTDSSHFLPVLDAAAEAMTGDQLWLEGRNETYRQRRDVVMQGLKTLGLFPDTPRASLYVWSSVPEGLTSLDFVNLALEKAHVSLTPGTVFGQNGEGYIRISLTSPLEQISQAMDQLTRVFHP